MNEKRMELYAALTIIAAIVLVGLTGGKQDASESLENLDAGRGIAPMGEKILAEKIEDDPTAWEGDDLPSENSPSNGPSDDGPPNARDKQNFQQQADYTYSILPTQDELRNLEPGSIHGTPPSIERAGRSLARIRKTLELRTGFEAEGLAFYRRCALSQDLAHSIRALCMSNYRHFAVRSSERSADPGELEEALPQGIVQASRALDPVQT